MDKAGLGGTRPNKIGPELMEGHGAGIQPKLDDNTGPLIAVQLPDSRALRILSKSLLLTMVLLALPSIYSLTKKVSSHINLYEHQVSDNGFKILPILLRNLMEEGLIKKGQMGFVFGAGQLENDLDFLKDAGIELLAGANVQKDRTFDFVFISSLRQVSQADGLIQGNGLIISPLGQDPPAGLRMHRNYRIVYLRRFESTVVAMRKTGYGAGPEKPPLCGATSEEKRAALKGLEDVFLEPPPRRAGPDLRKSVSRKIKFLPDLLKDELDEYPRRVFVTDDSGAVEWFYRNYPTRDEEFEVYSVERKGEEGGVSGWMEGKVRREDYVVMKAEAGVVEEMLRERTLCLVDELFLECRNQWVDMGGEKRAYWECLSLYGKVRDEGIAVHQWWD